MIWLSMAVTPNHQSCRPQGAVGEGHVWQSAAWGILRINGELTQRSPHNSYCLWGTNPIHA